MQKTTSEFVDDDDDDDDTTLLKRGERKTVRVRAVLFPPSSSSSRERDARVVPFAVSRLPRRFKRRREETLSKRRDLMRDEIRLRFSIDLAKKDDDDTDDKKKQQQQRGQQKCLTLCA